MTVKPTAEQLKANYAKKTQPEGIPKGCFCRKDLQADGLTQVQASALIRELAEQGAIECVGKFRIKKVSGDWGMVPFYKVVK